MQRNKKTFKAIVKLLVKQLVTICTYSSYYYVLKPYIRHELIVGLTYF